MKTIKTYKFSQGDKNIEFYIQGGDEVWLECSQGEDSILFSLDIEDIETIQNDIKELIFKFKNDKKT
jgi:hypothetical protein